MPTINADIVYKKPNKPKKISGQPISEDQLKALIDGVNACLKASDPAEFKGFMNKQVGPFANYPHKQDVMQGLKIIYDKFFDEQTEDSQKTMIAGRLLERAGACEEGFHNGVNMLIMGFNLAKNIGELVQQIKQSLVAETASELTDEVHSYNRCFIVASELYGVQPINQDDKYRGNIEDSTFEGKLSEKFAKLMQPLAMLGALEEAISDQLTSFGMESDTLTSDHLEGVKSYFLALFSDHVTVKAWVEAKQAFDAEKKSRLEETKGINDLFDQWVDQDQSAKAVLGNDPNHSKRSAIINFKIGDISTLPTPWLEKTEHFFDTLETSKQKELNQRLSNIETNRPLLLDKKQQFDKANHSLEELFFIHDEPSEENPNIRSGWRLNSQQIRSLLWQEMLTQRYFQFEKHEEPVFSAIINQNHQDRDMTNFALYIAQNNAYEQIVYLTADQQKSLINQIKKMDSNAKENQVKEAVYDNYIQSCLQYLSPENQSLAWKSIPNLSEFIDSAKNLSWLKYLNSEQSLSVFKNLLERGQLNRQKDKNKVDFYWMKTKYPELENTLLLYLATLPQTEQSKHLKNVRMGPYKNVLFYASHHAPSIFNQLFDIMEKNEQFAYDITLLSAAARAGANQSMGKLLKNGMDINGKEGQAMIEAAASGQVNALKFLLEHQGNPNIRDSNGLTPLLEAARNGHKAALQCLLQNKADLQARTNTGNNALNIALNNKKQDLVEIILIHLASLDKKQQAECLMTAADKPYQNVLLYAYEHQPNLCKALFNQIKASELVQLMDDEGPSLLVIAADAGATQSIDILLKSGKVIKPEELSEAIRISARNGHIETLIRLLAENPDLESINKSGSTALISAAIQGKTEAALLLLQKGAQVNARNTNEENALDIALKNKNNKLVDIILNHLATLSKKEQASCLAKLAYPSYTNILFYAYDHKPQLFHKLLDQMRINNQLNSVINDRNANGLTLMAAAAGLGSNESIELLLEQGMDINIDMGQALKTAVKNGQYSTLTFLLDKGARFDNNYSPLFEAAYHKNEEPFQILIERKANINARNANGTNIFDLAVLNNQQKIVALLSKHIAQLPLDQQEECLILCPNGPHKNILTWLVKNKTSQAELDNIAEIMLTSFKQSNTGCDQLNVILGDTEFFDQNLKSMYQIYLNPPKSSIKSVIQESLINCLEAKIELFQSKDNMDARINNYKKTYDKTINSTIRTLKRSYVFNVLAPIALFLCFPPITLLLLKNGTIQKHLDGLNKTIKTLNEIKKQISSINPSNTHEIVKNNNTFFSTSIEPESPQTGQDKTKDSRPKSAK